MSKVKKASYQKMRSELEDIILAMESADLDIESATKAYERGTELISSLEEHLKTAKNQITKVKNLRQKS